MPATEIPALAATALTVGVDPDTAWTIAEDIAARLSGREAFTAVIAAASAWAWPAAV